MHIWASLPEAQPAVEQRIAEISRWSFDVLERLPESCDDGRSPDGVEYTLNRRTLDDGRVEIVLQAYRPGRRILFIKFGQILARGFWAHMNGKRETMRDDELYDYT